MNARKLFALILILTLLTTLTGAAAAPLAGPCTPGAAYDPACDVNQDGHITIADIQLAAGHWNQNGAFVSDNNHNHLGQTWTGSNNPLTIQGSYGSPNWAPLILSNSGGVGVRVNAGGGSGVWVESAGNSGVLVDAAGNDGLFVCHTGTASTCIPSTTNNGVEIGNAQGYGLRVGSAGYDGVYVSSATGSGVHVNSVDGTGFGVNSAGSYGVFVQSAFLSGVFANTTQASGQWGFYTDGAIHGSNVLMHSLSLVAQVTGPDSLTPGDIVAVAGVADPVAGSTVHTPLVRLAGGIFTSVVGVVESHLGLVQQPSHPKPVEGETLTETPASELRSIDGPAQAGDYVAITVLGAAHVKVDNATAIEIGQRLTVAANGRARPLGTIKVQLAGDAGTADLPESAPVVGVALEPPIDGLVWVLVNPQ